MSLEVIQQFKGLTARCLLKSFSNLKGSLHDVFRSHSASKG